MGKYFLVLLLLVLIPGLAAAQNGYIKGPLQKRVIVFVNGVLGDSKTTWTHSNGSYWPHLIAGDPDLVDADVYVHNFVSPPIAAAQNIEELAGRMADYLETDGVFGRHEEIIFLCHSMGGLVTRAMLLRARVNPTKVPMIYFFGTPTGGANVAELPSILSKNPQFRHMLPLREEGYLAQLLDRWLDTSDDASSNYPNRIQSFCAYEKKDTFGIRVVEHQSAILLCNRRTRAVLSDHIEMVKPEDTKSEPYRYFKAAYLQLFRLSGPVIASGLQAGVFDRKAVGEQLTAAGFIHRDIPMAWIQGPKPTLAVHRKFISVEDEKVIPCGVVTRGRKTISIAIEPDQEIIAADVFGGGTGFERTGFSVTALGDRHIDVAFKLVAPPKTSPRCGTNQSAWAELRYVTSRAKGIYGLFGMEIQNLPRLPR